MKVLAILLSLFALPAQAQTGDFRVWGGGLAWFISQDAAERPMLSWSSDGTVRILVILQGGRGVDGKSGRAIVDGDDITLCYGILPIQPLPGGLLPPRASYPEVLEYTIPGLSTNKDYNIKLSQECAGG